MTSTMTYVREGVRETGVAANQRRSASTQAAPVADAALAPSNPQRLLNLVVAGLGLLLALPVMLVIALAIKLTSRGPVLYSQTRVGLDRRERRQFGDNHRRTDDLGGRPFTIFKFRTMQVHSGNGPGAVWAAKDDPRVTLVGRFLRQYRLDELPQLLNVLRGEMNIVGPRPEQPAIVRDLRDQVDQYPARHRALPGITGLAQINHHYDSCLDDVRTKVSYDLEYIRTQGLWEDLKIMAKTIPVMLFRRGGW